MNRGLLLIIIFVILWCLNKPEKYKFDEPYFMSRNETAKYFIEQIGGFNYFRVKYTFLFVVDCI